MLLIDDILAYPARGLFSVFTEIHKAAQQEITNEAEAVRSQLSELYVMLETGTISSEDFDAAEQELLDRLDAIEAREALAPTEENGGQ